MHLHYVIVAGNVVPCAASPQIAAAPKPLRFMEGIEAAVLKAFDGLPMKFRGVVSAITPDVKPFLQI
jgi:hypothetical protein